MDTLMLFLVIVIIAAFVFMPRSSRTKGECHRCGKWTGNGMPICSDCVPKKGAPIAGYQTSRPRGGHGTPMLPPRKP